MQDKRILCVDGGLASMLSWAAVLNRGDFLILAASGDDSEVLKTFQKELIDVVVLTSAVSNIDGLVREMKAVKPNVPVILFLPVHDNGARGVDHVVRDPSALLKTVGELV